MGDKFDNFSPFLINNHTAGYAEGSETFFLFLET